jgi:preprotein translocase subunit YajC
MYDMANLKNLLQSGADTTYYFILGGIVVFFVFMILMQSKRRRAAQTEYNGMIDTLRAGVRVKTVGGVIGKIIEMREEAPGFKTVLLETGAGKNVSYVLYDIQAIYGIVNDEAINRATQLTEKSAIQQSQPQNTDIANHQQPDQGVKKSENSFEAKKGKGKGNGAN